jgi:hypothetical protein
MQHAASRAATLQDVCAADVQALFNSNDCTEPVSAPLTKEQLRRMEVKRIATAVGDMLFPGLFLKMQMIRMYYQFMEAQGTPLSLRRGSTHSGPERAHADASAYRSRADAGGARLRRRHRQVRAQALPQAVLAVPAGHHAGAGSACCFRAARAKSHCASATYRFAQWRTCGREL